MAATVLLATALPSTVHAAAQNVPAPAVSSQDDSSTRSELDRERLRAMAVKRRGAGIGLVTTSAFTWAASLGLRIGAATAMRNCRREAEQSDGLEDALGCVGPGVAAVGMTTSAYVLDAAGVGFAIGGGALLGQASGLAALSDGRRLQERPGPLAAGASLLALGIGAIVVGHAVPWKDDQALLRMGLVTQLGVASASVGGSLLGHAIATQRFTVLSFAPFAARTSGGLTLTGRF